MIKQNLEDGAICSCPQTIRMKAFVTGTNSNDLYTSLCQINEDPKADSFLQIRNLGYMYQER